MEQTLPKRVRDHLRFIEVAIEENAKEMSEADLEAIIRSCDVIKIRCGTILEAKK